MPDRVRKVIVWIIFAFIIYAIFKSPDRAANIVNDIWDIISGGFRSLGKFFDNLMGRG